VNHSILSKLVTNMELLGCGNLREAKIAKLHPFQTDGVQFKTIGQEELMSIVRYTEDHEYIRIEEDVAVLGISGYAQDQLGDVVFVELPEVGKKIQKGDFVAVVESVKAAGEVLAPVSGEIVAVNDELENSPSKINEDAMGEGWIAKLKLLDTSELDDLMDEESYAAFIKDNE